MSGAAGWGCSSLFRHCRPIYGVDPARLSETPGFHQSPAPLFGQHTDEVCRRILELSDDEIAALLVERVLA